MPSLPADTQVFTAHLEGEDTLALTDEKGRYLSCNPGGGLFLADEKAEGSQSLWQLLPVYGGYSLKPPGAEKDLLLEYYGGRFNTYRPQNTAAYLFNFYEVSETAHRRHRLSRNNDFSLPLF